MDLSRYNKFWVALLAAAGVLVTVLAPEEGQEAFRVTANEWYAILVSFAGSLGVYQVKNSK